MEMRVANARKLNTSERIKLDMYSMCFNNIFSVCIAGSKFWKRDVSIVLRPYLNYTELVPVCEWILGLL